MPDTDSVVLVKAFGYRGTTEEFSNRYHFENYHPTDAANWLQLANSIFHAEEPSLPAAVQLVRAYGYNAGTEHSIWQHDFTSPGPPPAGTWVNPPWTYQAPGDTAATIRWNTGELNSRGKKIYCRKYMHCVFRDADGADKLDDVQFAALTAYATKMIDGTLWQGARYCGPQGANLSEPLVSPWLTTRTLKRRGKRPLP